MSSGRNIELAEMLLRCAYYIGISSTVFALTSVALPQNHVHLGSLGSGAQHAITSLGNPVYDRRILYAGDVLFSITNSGALTLGHGSDYTFSSKDKADLRITWYPSMEFPKFSRLGYFNISSLQFGAIRGTDTLVTSRFRVGGSFAEWHAFDTIQELSTLPRSRYYSDHAIGLQEYYLECTDTFINPAAIEYLDRDDQRTHQAIGVELHLRSFVADGEWLQRVVFFDAWFINISGAPLRGAVVSFIGDVNPSYDFSQSVFGIADRKTGSIGGIQWKHVSSPSGDSLDFVWFADEDGDPLGGRFGVQSPRAAVGIMPLRGPAMARLQYNWWGYVPSALAPFEWGPFKPMFRGTYTNFPGIPQGDRSLYRQLTNGEIDYEPVMAALDMTHEGWSRPPETDWQRRELADGTFLTMCLSYGPVPLLLPGDSVPFSFAIVTGDNFHRDPGNFARDFDAYQPTTYLRNLDFHDLAENARAAREYFDNPGVDSDGDGFRGGFRLDCGSAAECDTTWISGDGVPDWGGPKPPPPPIFETTTAPHSVKLRWDGALTEFAVDHFSGRRDFEGYRIYSSRSTRPDEFALIASWDLPDNYYRLEYESKQGTWSRISYPLPLEHWADEIGGIFDPRQYPHPSLMNAYRDTILDTARDQYGNIIEIANRERLSYWASEGPNYGNSYTVAGQIQHNLIQRVATRDTVIAGEVFSYGVYEATVENLNATVPLNFAVTSFDHGEYRKRLAPQESPPAANSRNLFPVYSADVVVDSALRVSVYPNPYKYSFPDAQGRTTTYFGQGYEGFGQTHLNEQDRRIWFANLPDTATIRIYSLDGDLIREIHHPDQFLTRYSSVVGWDLVSRNTQAVVSGIYLWRVDSRLGSQIGKIVIIK